MTLEQLQQTKAELLKEHEKVFGILQQTIGALQLIDHQIQLEQAPPSAEPAKELDEAATV